MSISANLYKNCREAVQAFTPDRTMISLARLGKGHINDTFLVTYEGAQPARYVLQRLNRQVFPQPELIMGNLRILTDHLDRHLQNKENSHLLENWEVIRPIKTVDGRDYFVDSANNFWRLLNYINGAVAFDRIQGTDHAKEAGKALGLFHRLAWDLNPELLSDTLPGFHVTPKYLAAYDRVLRQPVRQISSVDEKHCADNIEKFRSFAPILENAASQGLLSIKIIHGDPRLANIMFEERTGRAVSIIDLDTVKPGLLHYDIGDCLRSCCNLMGDNPDKPGDVRFDIEICRELLGGYLAEMAPLLTDTDYEFIYQAAKLMTFELALRFFTDHLAGDVYFKQDYSGQNLQRAIAQFRLLNSIAESKHLICRTVNEWRQIFSR